MGRTRVGPQAIGEYLVRMRERYERAPRGKKGRLLDDVCGRRWLGGGDDRCRVGTRGVEDAASSAEEKTSASCSVSRRPFSADFCAAVRDRRGSLSPPGHGADLPR